MDDYVEKLTKYFLRFPGIGSRQARRLSYFLISEDGAFVKELTETMLEASEHTARCASCYRLCSISSAETRACDLCLDPHIDKGKLLVIEKDVDFENIHKMGVFDGRFFVLGGAVPLMDKTPAEKIRIKELFERVRVGIKDGLKEIILALSVTPEGENTERYIIKTLEPFTQKTSLKISVLGRGLSTGTELEYSDDDTLRNALRNRK